MVSAASLLRRALLVVIPLALLLCLRSDPQAVRGALAPATPPLKETFVLPTAAPLPALQHEEEASSLEVKSSTTKLGSISPVIWTYSPWNYNGGLAHWIFLPVLVTLKEAFALHGLELRYGGFENVCEVVRNVKQALQKGLVPVVIVIGWHLFSLCPRKCMKYKKDTCLLADGLREVIEMGAHIVLYNSESQDRLLVPQVKSVPTMKAKEIWTYSKVLHGKLESVLDDAKIPGVHVRYIPPGCASALDFNATLDAPWRDDNTAGFLGNIKGIPHRLGVINSLGKISVETPRPEIQNGRDVSRFLQRHPIQLNIHGHSDHSVLELFRLSMMLTNKACVFSEDVAPEDASDLEDIVSFTGSNRSSMKSAVSKVIGNAREIRSCQARSKEMFCQRFSPAQIMERSGFMEQWHTAGPRTVND